jgi:glycosyltransferase involved in cell wall biosynthesis
LKEKASKQPFKTWDAEASLLTPEKEALAAPEFAAVKETLAAREGELAGVKEALATREQQLEALNQALASWEGELATVKSRLAELATREDELADVNRQLTSDVAAREAKISLLVRSMYRRSGRRLLIRLRYSAVGYALGQAWQTLRARSLTPLRDWRATRVIARSDIFDREWYLTNSPDLLASGIDPIRHYVAYGAREGRDPSQSFSTTDYLANNADVAAAGANPLAHFIRHGTSERRAAHLSGELARNCQGHATNVGSSTNYSDELATNQSSSGLIWQLETAPPAKAYVGSGTAILLSGWCYSKKGAIRALEMVAEDRTFRIRHSWARPDVLRSQCPIADHTGNSLMSGFRAIVPVEAIAEPERLSLRLRATLRGGGIIDAPVGQVQLLPGIGAQPTQVVWPGVGPRVVICMTTYDPPFDLFDVQVMSIQEQSHTNWVCIVSDDHSPLGAFEKICDRLKADKRFYVFRNAERLGFYHNFESCLKRIPLDAEFVALSDQDDRWNPNKLETLLAAFDQETQLVYSDARIVAPDGQVRSNTFWRGRDNNYTDLSALMVANTITGAASVFRASLVPEVLPFPKPIGHAFHDHWIGLTALVKGKIGYIDQALYDYVQHAANVIGHKYGNVPGLIAAGRQLARAVGDRDRLYLLIRNILQRALEHYELVVQKVFLSRVLLMRFPKASRQKRTILKRFSRFENSVTAAVQEKLLALVHRRPTLNYEGLLLYSTAVMRLRNTAFRYLKRNLVIRQLRGAAAGPIAPVSLTNVAKRSAKGPVPAPAQGVAPLSVVPALETGKLSWISHNVSPLKLDVSPRYPPRVNLLLATIEFKYVYAGYIGMFSLALRLKRAGHDVRIILHEQTDFKLDEWRRLIKKYPGVTTLFDEVEVIYRFDRSEPVEVNPHDHFIATNCWAAHIAHHAVRALGKERFIFMIQEYEPYFSPMNSVSALFQQAYELPHFGLFSTDFLHDFFRDRRIGVFGEPHGERYAAVFQNAIHRFTPSRERLTRNNKQVLFYARPEDHAARNLFELGMLSLVALVSDPRFDCSNWKFRGIGSITVGETLELAPGVPIEILPKMSLQEYIEVLPDFDVGLSLMLTPHPSLVPLEMASAGMCTVTNTFANKTADRLRTISSNLIGVKPTVEAIRDGLLEASSRVHDIDSRLAGAHVHWPTDWTSAFPVETINKLNAFLADRSEAAPGIAAFRANHEIGGDERPMSVYQATAALAKLDIA